MKNSILGFIRRGLVACGIGPIVLAVVYLIVGNVTGIETLSVKEVCVGIFSLAALAFIAGGMNFLYHIERLPLTLAILIHGGVLYLCYLATYLINGWLRWDTVHLLVFSGIFVLGYIVIWLTIYSLVKKSTEDINEKLRKKREEK